MESVTYGASKFVAGGDSGVICTSTNGIAWTVSSSPTSSNINYVTFTGSNFYYAGSGGALGYSTDAITWTDITFGSAYISCLAYSGTTYVCGGPGWAASSATGTSGWTYGWHVYAPNFCITSNPTLNAITYSTVFLAADSNQNSLTSTDAVTWTSHLGSCPSSWLYLGSGGGVFAGSTGGSSIGTSTDGITWATFASSGACQITSGTSPLACAGSAIYLSYSGTPYDHTTSFALPTDADLAITVESPSYFKRGLYIKAL